MFSFILTVCGCQDEGADGLRGFVEGDGSFSRRLRSILYGEVRVIQCVGFSEELDAIRLSGSQLFHAYCGSISINGHREDEQFCYYSGQFLIPGSLVSTM